MRRILEGIRVLDLTQFLSGPQATLLLAGMGADVVQVDHPLTGNRTIHAPPYLGPQGVTLERRTPQDMGVHYLKRSRGKRSITLDLKRPEGIGLFLRLADRADVLVENFSVGVTARLGIDYERLRVRNPRLVYCSITGYGATGPDRHLKSYDVIAQAASGLMGVTGRPGDAPLKAGPSIADSSSGVFATAGVLAALLHRERSGEGQWVDVSMVDGLFSLVFDEPLDWYEALGLPFQQGNRIPRLSPFDTFPTSDGWVVIGVATEAQWGDVLEVIGHPELKGDARFADPGWRVANNAQVDALVSAWTRARTTAAAIEALRAADVVTGPIRTIADLRDWAQLRERGMWTELEHPGLPGPTGVGAPGFPIRFSATPGGYDRPAPRCGEHNAEVFGHWLGIDAAELARLKVGGVV